MQVQKEIQSTKKVVGIATDGILAGIIVTVLFQPFLSSQLQFSLPHPLLDSIVKGAVLGLLFIFAFVLIGIARSMTGKEY